MGSAFARPSLPKVNPRLLILACLMIGLPTAPLLAVVTMTITPPSQTIILGQTACFNVAVSGVPSGTSVALDFDSDAGGSVTVQFLNASGGTFNFQGCATPSKIGSHTLT